jgi:hypothetical protein
MIRVIRTHTPWATVVLVLGCRGPAPAAPAVSNAGIVDAATPVGRATYAHLFDANATWRLNVTTTHSYWDQADPKANANGFVESSDSSVVSCRVVEAVEFPGGRASTIACDDDADYRLNDLVAGAWVLTTDGLWHGSDMPGPGLAPDLALEERLLAADPVAGQTMDEDPEEDNGPAGGVGSVVDITANGDGWCIHNGYWGGDESSTTICLDSRGLASGQQSFDGGESKELAFERAE